MSKTKGKKIKVKVNLSDVVELKKYEGIDPTQKNPALAVTIDSDLSLAVCASYKLTKDIYRMSVKDKKKKKGKRILIPYHHTIIKKTWETYSVLMPIISDPSMPASYEGTRMMEISVLYAFMSMMSSNLFVDTLVRTIPFLIAPSRITELKPAILKNIIAVSEHSKEWYDTMGVYGRRYTPTNIDFIHDDDDDVIDDEDDEEIGDLIVSGFEKKFEEAKERARKRIREIEDSMAPTIPIVDPSTEEGKAFLKEHSTPLSSNEDEITEKDKEFLREHAPDKSTKTNSLKFKEVFEIYFSDLNEKAQKRLLDFVGISSPSEAWDTTLPIAVCEKDSASGNCTCTLVGWWAPVEPEEANEEPDTDK